MQLLSFLFVTVNSLILIPKPIVSILDLDTFNVEHDIHVLATIGDFTVYKTNNKSYLGTLEQFFDIEEEQVYRIGSIRKSIYNFYEEVDRILFGNLTDVPWHLDRIVQRDLPLENKYSVKSCNTNKDIIVNNIVIDTGIDITHPEFERRAKWLGNFIDKDDFDGNSHGTHCGGLIGSKTFGVCKDANLYAIKVLGSDGSGSTSSVIAGIEAAYKFHTQQKILSGKRVKTIVSMSLGGGKSLALNRAVEATIKDPNFYFAAAAGNEDQDSCFTSPASVLGIFTVMASGIDDKRAYFSNYGRCADIYSPGVNIESTIPDGETAVYSGSSMSTPILVGVLNYYVNLYPELNIKELKEKVLSESTKNKITGNPKQTNNFLAYIKI